MALAASRITPSTRSGLESMGTWLLAPSTVVACPHALRHETFQVGVDGAVVLGHDVPARLRPPRDAVDLLREKVGHGRGLSCPDYLLLRLGEVPREVGHAIRA